MTRSNNIFGMRIAGTGLALFLLAGSTAFACPEHDKTTKGDPPTCSQCVVVTKADTCDQPEGKKTQRTVVLRIGADKLDLGDGSFGDLKFDGDDLVVWGPEKKQHVIVKRLHTSGQPEREIRVEIRIVGPDGEAREFSFKGEDFDFDFGDFDFGDFDFDFDELGGMKHFGQLHELEGLKGLHGIKALGGLLELKGLHEIEGLRGLLELKEFKGLHGINELHGLKGMNGIEKLHEHLLQLGAAHGNAERGNHQAIVIELDDIEGLHGLSEKIHAMVTQGLKSHGGENFFVIDGDEKFGDDEHGFIFRGGPEKGRHGIGEWRSDDGNMHIIIELDGDAKHRVERRIRIGSGSSGLHEMHAMGGTSGHVVIVGPDGEKHEFRFGGGEGAGHDEGHGVGTEIHKIIKRRSSGGGAWFDSNDGNIKIQGKAIFIGPDGEKHEIHFDPRSGNGKDAPHGVHGLMGSAGGGGISWFQEGDDASFEVSPVYASFGELTLEEGSAFSSPDHNVSFAPEANFAFSLPDGDVRFSEAEVDDTISIEIVNGKVTAKINGKRVPASRIKHTDKGIEIIGEDGKVVATVPMMGSFGSVGRNVLFGGQGEDAPRAMWVTGEDQPEPPRVMLGIQMQAVSADAMDRYNFDEGEGIQIIGVIKGLPAQRAGLRENDIIVEIAGIGRVTQEGLRGILLSKNPGDVMALEVIRDGEIEEIEIILSPYDAEKLGKFALATPQNIQAFTDWGGGGDWKAGNFEEMIEKFKGQMGKFNFDEDEMEIATEAFEEAMEGVKEQAAEGGFLLRWGLPGAGQWRVIHGDEPEQIFTIPVEPRTGGGNVAKELALLKDQLAQVQSQRNELAAELAEIKELLKKLARDRD